MYIFFFQLGSAEEGIEKYSQEPKPKRVCAEPKISDVTAMQTTSTRTARNTNRPRRYIEEFYVEE